MREFFRSRFFKVVMVVLAFLLGFMIYAISQNGVGAVTSQIVGAISAPFQKLSSYISVILSLSITRLPRKLLPSLTMVHP